jgi:phosphopantetheine--protein transferase-like protein
LKRLGLAIAPGSAPATFGGLLAALSGDIKRENPAKAASASPTGLEPNRIGGFAGLQVGLDVENIGSLPVASDYWEHEFYRGTFARSEIAYAVLHVGPRTHFAGFWCAKEALRKCDPSLADVSMVRTAIGHDADGRPYFTLETESGLQRLPHAVSISHTAEVATAVVVAVPAVSAAITIAPPSLPKIEAGIEPAPETKKSRGLAKLLGI